MPYAERTKVNVFDTRSEIVMPGNVTVEQMALPAVAEAYKSGKAPAMLLEWNQ